MISKENIMNLKIRQEIYEFVKKNPGLNFFQISNKMKMPLSTLKYHIKFLEKLELIDFKTDGRSSLVFVLNKMDRRDKQIFEFLRKDIPCKILLYIFFSIFCSQSEISKTLDISAPNVSYHLKKMKKKGIINEAYSSNGWVYPYYSSVLPEWKYFRFYRPAVKSEKFYVITQGYISNQTYRLLIMFKDRLKNKKLIEELIFVFNETGWYEMSEEEKEQYKKLLEKDYVSIDDKFDTILDFLMEYFKPPFVI